jgi:hypothetical protein
MRNDATSLFARANKGWAPTASLTRIKYVDFAKMLSGQVRRGTSVVLCPAASQDHCQGAMQGLEELRSNGRRLNEVAASLRQGPLDAGSLRLRLPSD